MLLTNELTSGQLADTRKESMSVGPSAGSARRAGAAEQREQNRAREGCRVRRSGR